MNTSAIKATYIHACMLVRLSVLVLSILKFVAEEYYDLLGTKLNVFMLCISISWFK